MSTLRRRRCCISVSCSPFSKPWFNLASALLCLHMRKPNPLVLYGVGNAVGIRFTTLMASAAFPRLASSAILSTLPTSFVCFFCFIPPKELSARATCYHLCLLLPHFRQPATATPTFKVMESWASHTVQTLATRMQCVWRAPRWDVVELWVRRQENPMSFV
jgi:hypothetical protein